MAIVSDIQPPPKAPSFSAKLDRSNPLEFVEKALAFLARESDFFHRERVEREVASVVRTLREQERKKVERKKKADAEAAKLMEMEGSEKKAAAYAEAAKKLEMEGSEKKADAEAAKLMEMESSEKKTTSETSSSSIPHYKELNSLSLLEHVREAMEELANGKKLRRPATKRIKPAKDFYPVASRYYDTLKNKPPQEDSWPLHREVYAGKIDRRVFVHVYASILADQHDAKESERKWDRRMRAHRKICENHDETCFEYY
ncbi:unnamed protein product [Malus baccata var. baccata]